ncbi:hypothetical protein RvY_17746-2 [Ramazzottius varieornatus]|nr:hypothetical protein RvY_17746-2 [Ramazzottius varieornatus]
MNVSDYITPDYKSQYVLSRDLSSSLLIKVCGLDGSPSRLSTEELLENPVRRFNEPDVDQLPEIVVQCQLYSRGKIITLDTKTRHKAFTKRITWNEWLRLPIHICDLPRDTLLVFTLYEMDGPYQVKPVGGTTISAFGKTGKLRCGNLDLFVWPKVHGDGSASNSTPGKIRDDGRQMGRLAKLVKRHRSGRIRNVDWLDKLTFRELEHINEREKKEMNSMFLRVEFPPITVDEKEVTVIYYEEGADRRVECLVTPTVVKVFDGELDKPNVIERKHHILARNVRSGASDRELKPNSLAREQLTVILAYPPDQPLTSEEQDLVWRYRFYLSQNKRALIKFLSCVNWHIPAEQVQAEKMLFQWVPADPGDALALLTSRFTNPVIRQYAVDRLADASDDDLLLYLLQLIQALRYEDILEIRNGLVRISHAVMSTGRKESIADKNTEPIGEGMEMVPRKRDLATFLIDRSCRNPKLANYFYWFLKVECEKDRQTADPSPEHQDNRLMGTFLVVTKRFSNTLTQGGEICKSIRTTLSRQLVFVERLVRLMRDIRKDGANRKKKTERLQTILANPDSDFCKCFSQDDPLAHPLDPDVVVAGIRADATYLFKSAQMPVRLTFVKEDGSDFVTIFKLGDDLRQDQLVLQIISLMDKLLRQENLDLKLTPYKVIATSTDHGFVQFIDSVPLAEILANDFSILNFLRKHAPSKTTASGVSTEVMENYVKSCAGYCVVTYLLGVGDRHLENLLLTKQGNLFHIDFGYILGRDPKPMPPAMKLNKEMVEAMGEEYFRTFCVQCYSAFLNLRR